MTPDAYQSPRQQRMAVIASVAKAHGVSVAAIMGKRRHREIVEARWDAMHRIKVLFGDSHVRIGRLFKRDHTSVMYALKEREARL